MTATDVTRDLAEILRAVLLGNGLAQLTQDGVLQAKKSEPSVLAAIRAIQPYEAVR